MTTHYSFADVPRNGRQLKTACGQWVYPSEIVHQLEDTTCERCRDIVIERDEYVDALLESFREVQS
jgi:hypothetical protein